MTVILTSKGITFDQSGTYYVLQINPLIFLAGGRVLCLLLVELNVSKIARAFPGSSAGKESACNAGDPSSIPGLGRPPAEGIG